MIECSQCGAVKRDVNHWHIAGVDSFRRRYWSLPFSEADYLNVGREADVNVLCGDNCAHKAYQQYLDKLRETQ